MEREADRIGFGVLQQAGFDPQGAVGMFDKLLNASRLNDSGQFPYLRSHPLSTERMADMRGRLGLQGQSATTEATPSLAHAMVAARAKHAGDGSADAAQAWQQQASPAALNRLPPHAQAGALYGAALSAMQQRNWPLADQLLSRLQGLLAAQGQGSTSAAAAPATEAQRLARLLAAELALLQGQPQRSLDLLSAAAASPGRPEALLAAAAQVAAGQPGQAVQALRVWTSHHPRDASAWQLLSGAHAALSQPALAARAQAEARAAHYDYSAAQDRLKSAQDLARQAVAQGRLDHIEASIIDARLRAVGQLAREQAQDAPR
jgi:predicted Zn-dependent protease